MFMEQVAGCCWTRWPNVLEYAVYKQRKEWDDIGKHYDNALIAKKLGITIETSDVVGNGGALGEMSIAAGNARALSTKISKLNSQAKKMIANAGKGLFP